MAAVMPLIRTGLVGLGGLFGPGWHGTRGRFTASWKGCIYILGARIIIA
jgi:hypothetical protein